MNISRLQTLRRFAQIEGTSTLLLFGLAMPLKYWAGWPLAVKIFGPVHGLLFLGLLVTSVISIWWVPIGLRLGLASMVGAIVPFGPFLVDQWLKTLEPKQS